MLREPIELTIDIADRIHHHGFKRLLLAVSGGLDSICLAHYFIKNREALGIEWLGIAHVHHGLRKGTADRDAAFVETFARKYEIPFFLKKLDGEALKAADGSLEENARDARYQALFDVMRKEVPGPLNQVQGREDTNGAAIVTAHHAGDQAETMYMRIRRGTTLAGLRGIQTLRQAQGPFIYRPLLSVTRTELLAYAKEHNLTWCEDESNSDVKFARNKIRHEMLPHLEESCPGATKQLCRFAELADRAYGKVMQACDALFNPVLQQQEEMPGQAGHDKKEAGMTNNEKNNNGLLRFARNDVQLNKKALRKILLAHADADLSEMFRLWLSEQGFRFPIGFFYDPKEPAHVKIPVRAAYRKRSIVKKGSTVLICEFESVAEALKFVSCK